MLNLTGQNQFDEQGKKTGLWKGYYPDSTIRYEGTFKQGKPHGLMKRYDKDGVLSITLNYKYPQPERCFATLYSPGGKKKATGVYHQRSKDSTWTYYGMDEIVYLVENYSMGILNGKAHYYYPTGKIAQIMRFEDGLKNGPWLKFFESGDTMMVANYEDDILEGKYYTYYEEGDIQIDGAYKSDLKHGDWEYFSMEGDTMFVIKYDNGKVMNPEVMEARYEEFIQTIEEKEGNMPDPANMGDF